MILTFAAQQTLAGYALHAIPLKSQITHVQPMTGIVLWAPPLGEDTKAVETQDIQLEFLRMGYDEVVKGQGDYDWPVLDERLKAIASRHHQAVLRFIEADNVGETKVPAYIKAQKGYLPEPVIEGTAIKLPNWSHKNYGTFFSDFYQALAKRYDQDSRLAFLQVGFGLWAEYHICPDDCPQQIILGSNFPSKDFQTAFFNLLDKSFQQTPWMISQDAYVETHTPFKANDPLLKLRFGIFDDTFDRAWDVQSENYKGWKLFGLDRFKRAPTGGEIYFSSTTEEARAKTVAKKWAEKARLFGISFMLGETWSKWPQTSDIKKYGLNSGYKFEVTKFDAGPTTTTVRVKNIGVAPIYFDAYVALNCANSNSSTNCTRAQGSLKGLLPGQERPFTISSGVSTGALSIESPRLVQGQRIEFKADLK